MAKASEWQKILDLGFEGGGLTLIGREDAAGWEFELVTDFSTLADFLSEEEAAEESLTSRSGRVRGWDAAVALLRSEVLRGVPLHLHPAFRDRVQAVMTALAANEPNRAELLRDWHERLARLDRES